VGYQFVNAEFGAAAVRITGREAGGHAAERCFYLHDRLGSVRLLIDTSASVKNRYIYDPFGQLHDSSADCEETIANPFMFTGQYFDSDIDQYYLRARQHDSQFRGNVPEAAETPFLGNTRTIS
jgi:hypothetical protein